MKYLIKFRIFRERDNEFIFNDFEEAMIFVSSALKHGDENLEVVIKTIQEEVKNGREE